MTQYLKDIKGVCEQLASIGNPVSEKMKIFAALHGLGREYEPIKTSIEGSMDAHPSPTFEDIIPRLTGYDNRLQTYSTGSDVTPHLAFLTSQQASGFYSNRGRGSNNRRFGAQRGRSSFSTRGRGFHQQISSYYGSSNAHDVDNRPVCQICEKRGHHVVLCWHRFDNSYQHEDLPSALTALRIADVSETSGREWLPDSGATAHVTNSPHH